MLKCRSGDDFNTAHIYAQNIDSMHCNRRDNTTNVYFDAILLSCVLCFVCVSPTNSLCYACKSVAHNAKHVKQTHTFKSTEMR